MSTATITEYKQDQAIAHFEQKLAFEVGPIGLANQIQNKTAVQIVDLRTPELYAKSHVPNAINLSYENLEAGKFELDQKTPVVVYCYDIVCNLSTKAALLLAKKGYQAKELVGGFADWEQHTLPVEKKAGGSCCGG